MAGGFVGTADTGRVEAPVTWKSYMMCAFAAFGGIFFGYDSGYISGVLAMDYFINLFTGIPIPGPDASAAEIAAFVIPTPHKTLIVSILSAGTFFGAIFAGDLADWYGRRTTVILGCLVYAVGCIMQTACTGLGLLVAGRLIAGFGVGFVSAIIILYMSEIAPKAVRGAMVSGMAFLPSPSSCRYLLTSQVTNSPLPSVFSLPLASTMPPKTAWTAVLTVSPWLCNSSGLLFSLPVSLGSLNPLATSS
jgi:MFS family permease